MDTHTGVVGESVGRQGQAPRTRVWRRALVVAGLVLTLGGTAGWGQVPSTNDTSDDNGNTGGGTDALVNVTPGVPNPSSGINNTAYGASALGGNTTGADNTAYGASALGSNTTGTNNTAVGVNALLSNTEGGANTGVGAFALLSNTEGTNNTAFGDSALTSNTAGTHNSALGAFALQSNTEGDSNTAFGDSALGSSTGNSNAAFGDSALLNNGAGNGNTAFGTDALHNSTGNNNIAVGSEAGVKLTSGNNNIYLGHLGRASEAKTMRLGRVQTRTFIAGIVGIPLNGSMVLIDSNGQLGVPVSSARYKHAIQGMGERSRGVFKLRPVTFRYKQDAQGQRQYGLIAEEVAKVYPELVTKGADGKVESVQYHELIPLLLNEVQQQQQALRVQAQQVAELKAQNESLQAALVEQNAALAARLEQLEAGAARAATLATR